MADKRNNRLLNAKLNKYIVPGIMMSLALQLGNIVDTIFVSNLIGVEAMSAVTMSLPVETIIQLTGYCLGIGGSIAVGNMLGKRDKESASKLFTVTFLVTLLAGFLFFIYCIPGSRSDCETLSTWRRNTDNPYSRLYPDQHAWCTDYWNWSYDGELSWCGKSPGACIHLPYPSQCNQSDSRLYFSKIHPAWNCGCVPFYRAWFLLAMVVFVFYIRSDKRNIRFVHLKPKDFCHPQGSSGYRCSDAGFHGDKFYQGTWA